MRNVEKRFFVFMLILFAFHAHPMVNHRLFLQWVLSALVLRIIQIENLVVFPFGDFVVHVRLYPFAMPRRGFLHGKIKLQVRKCLWGESGRG